MPETMTYPERVRDIQDSIQSLGSRSQEERVAEMVRTADDDVEASQIKLAYAKSELIRPRLRSWFTKKDHRRYEDAARENKRAVEAQFQERLENETLSGDDLREAAAGHVVENMRAVDGIAADSLRGTKSGAVVSWFKERGGIVKGAAATVVGFLGGGILGSAANGAWASRMGRTHFADNYEAIAERDAAARETIKARLTHEATGPVDIRAMLNEAQEISQSRIEEERSEVGRHVGPIAVGNVVGVSFGVGVNIAANRLT